MNIERGRTKHKLCHMVMGIAATLFYIVPSFAKDGAAVYEFGIQVSLHVLFPPWPRCYPCHRITMTHHFASP